ncbi:hypothetical protein NQ317_004393 [Molorchus minor]|uniref:PPIase cyclophilin-type domain-containing protein n=1 Tax=Molorchus minor TaxID=1323400 RepID=A0ABQ9IXJ8_9CUCU|nr:hypothetical protein NQ317_004393 [Molorchus minor]
MLNVEWTEYIIKLQRKIGNGVWALKKPLAIFLNDEFLGDEETLMKHLSKRYRFTLKQDWYELGKCHLTEYLGNIMRKFRQLAYITVSINHRVIGTLLFELYNDLVPLACENFMTKCKLEIGGYVGTPIHSQLIQGAEVLKQIEDLPTYYQQSPTVPIDIVKTGELVFNPPPDYITEEEYDKFQAIEPTALLDALIGPRMGTSDSMFSMTKFLMGLYGLGTDMRSYLPVQVPQYVIQGEDYQITKYVDKDYLWYEKMRRQAFFKLGLLTDNVPVAPFSPGSSDITLSI